MDSILDLRGKCAVVTGGAGLLGSHFCGGLAAHGARVAVVDVREDEARALASRLTAEHGVEAIGVGCDVSDPVSVAAMVEAVVAAFGGIHVLHNNAATRGTDLDALFAPFEEFTLDTWRRIMAVNLDGMFLVAQAVGRQMIRQGTGGAVVQTASIYGHVAPDPRIYEGSFYLGRTINTPAVYAASKAGVIGLTRYLAVHWAPHKIRVNTLSPGGVASGQNEIFQRRYSERVPLARMGEAAEMVGALLYLVSDAASYVTGQVLLVDGGWTAW